MARITGKPTQETMVLNEKRLKRLCNANPVETAENLDDQDF